MKTAIILISAVALSGCAAPLAMMAGNLAISEVVTDRINPGAQVNGAYLYKSARWDERYTTTAYSMFGRSTWVCARDNTGTAVCVPPDDANAKSVSSKAIFSCRMGQGGMIASLVDPSNSTTLFCERVRG